VKSETFVWFIPSEARFDEGRIRALLYIIDYSAIEEKRLYPPLNLHLFYYNLEFKGATEELQGLIKGEIIQGNILKGGGLMRRAYPILLWKITIDQKGHNLIVNSSFIEGEHERPLFENGQWSLIEKDWVGPSQPAEYDLNEIRDCLQEISEHFPSSEYEVQEMVEILWKGKDRREIQKITKDFVRRWKKAQDNLQAYLYLYLMFRRANRPRRSRKPQKKGKKGLRPSEEFLW